MVKNLEQLQTVLGNLEGAIFDMDGTLIDLEDLNYASYARTVRAAFGLELSKDECHRYFSGTKTSQGFTTYLESAGVSDFDVDELIKDFRVEKRWNLQNNIENVVTLREGTRDLLELFKSRGLGCALVTSTIKEFTDLIIDHLDLRQYFSVILTAEDVSAGKPDPTIYNTAAERLGIAKTNLVVFEDSLNGIQAAKNAEITCIGIYDNTWNHAYVDAADIVIEHFGLLN